jgi:hypothetical protein
MTSGNMDAWIMDAWSTAIMFSAYIPQVLHYFTRTESSRHRDIYEPISDSITFGFYYIFWFREVLFVLSYVSYVYWFYIVCTSIMFS